MKKVIAEYDRVHIGPPGGARKLMVDAPTADVAEVMHGVWAFAGYSLMGERAYQCSLCNFAVANIDDVEMKYCPGCGAKMDGEKVNHN